MSANRDKTLGQRLDALATGSGLYAVTMIDRPEPRNLRVLPGLILVALVAGYALTWLGLNGLDRSALVLRVAIGMGGPLLFFGALLAANWARFAGPRIVPGPTVSLDERERMLRATAGSISGAIVTVLVIAGCFYLGVAQILGWWMPSHVADWIYLGLLIEGWALTLPVLVASWLQPADVPEEA